MFQGSEFFRVFSSNLKNLALEITSMKIVFLIFKWIWETSETDLNQLDLTEKGDIIRLKAFAVEKSENKKKLGELITNAGK